MALSLTLTVAVDATSGPFPPVYPAGASGFVAANSNPSATSAGALSPAVYYTSPILAVANDAAGASAKQLCVALQGIFDQTFLGDVTTPDGKVYQSKNATFTNSTVGANSVATWIWPLAVGAVALVSGTVTIGNTNDALIQLTGSAPSSTQINLSWVNKGPTPPANYLLYRSIGATALPTLYQTLSGSTLAFNDTGLSANTQYNYFVVASYADGTTIASGAAITGIGGTFTSTLGLGFNGSGGIGGETCDGGFGVIPPCSGAQGSLSNQTLPDLNAVGALYTHSGGGNNSIVLALKGLHNQFSYFAAVNYTGQQSFLDPAGGGLAINFSTSSAPGWSVWRWGPAVPSALPALGAGTVTITGLPTLTYVPLNLFTPVAGISDTFNCACESQPLPADGFVVDTLGNLRTRVLIRCGYAAQAANPPPGMKILVNEFLRTAQNQLYRQHSEFRTKRLYAWQMEPNVRYYGLNADESNCRRVDPLSIDWVGFEDLNQAWYPLISGIDPVLYTRAQISTGWPTHYEIRSCIEIFPAPRAAYTLWIKGRFGIDPFAADTDTTTVDAEAVYLLASGFVKAHYGQVDAQAVLTQAGNYTKYLVAGQHGTRRYVPRTRVQTPMTPPRFLPLES